MSYDLTNEVGKVRLLINDIDRTAPLYLDAEIEAFLDLEGGDIKLAAAQALDTIADNEVLTAKVIKDHDHETDGAKVADALRKRAVALRNQAMDSELGGYFEIVQIGGVTTPELAQPESPWPW